jgi:hypothetical protein
MVYIFQVHKETSFFHSVLIALKLQLTQQQHKINRLEFAHNKIKNSREYYQTQYNVIHINKNNFHIGKKTWRVFVGIGKVLPHRLHQNANYIQKVMFLAAVAKPVQRFPNVAPKNQQWD